MFDIFSSYDLNKTTELCAIMEKYGSDKGQSSIHGRNWHNYTIVYNEIFKNKKNNNLRIFELGLGTNNTNILSNMGKHGKPGASLRGWRDYFHNSIIFGADIDKDVLFTENRIKTYYCDQLKPHVIKSMWEETPELSENFDIIIEDGLHTFEANKCFFENSFYKVKTGGVYIIEDVSINDISKYNQQLLDWKKQFPILAYNIVILPHKRNTYDNCLICITK